VAGEFIKKSRSEKQLGFLLRSFFVYCDAEKDSRDELSIELLKAAKTDEERAQQIENLREKLNQL